MLGSLSARVILSKINYLPDIYEMLYEDLKRSLNYSKYTVGLK